MLLRNTLAMAVVVAFAGQALAGGNLYFDRGLFNSDANMGATVIEDFDSDAALTDLTNQTRSGMMLTSPSGSALTVIQASTGVRFPMNASSGKNVLSPGGSDKGIEDDDFTILFTTSVQAFGLDVVFDVPDGASYVGVTFRDAAGAEIASNGFIPAPNGLPGYMFVGFVSDSANIASVTFDEFDPSPDDDHVAYDTLTVSVPTPGALALLAMSGFVIARRKR
jgi:hypothetical protein